MYVFAFPTLVKCYCFLFLLDSFIFSSVRFFWFKFLCWTLSMTYIRLVLSMTYIRLVIVNAVIVPFFYQIFLPHLYDFSCSLCCVHWINKTNESTLSSVYNSVPPSSSSLTSLYTMPPQPPHYKALIKFINIILVCFYYSLF